jgi:hypothetical protein
MTIKEAKSIDLLLNNFTPFTVILLPESQRKSIDILKKSVEKKKQQYSRYFKN